MNQEDRHVKTYLEEARELLAELEEATLKLEEDAENKELVNRVFRAMHTIKCPGAMFGFDEVADFTHNIESVLDQVRNGKVPVTRELTGLILAACDEIGRMLFPEKGKSQGPEIRNKLTASFASLLSSSKDSELEKEKGTPAKGNNKEQGGDSKSDHMYRIRFIPARKVFHFGIDPLAILNELQGLGQLEITALTDEIPNLEEIRHDECYLGWDLVLVSKADINVVKDVFIFVEGDSEVTVQEIPPDEERQQRVGDILVERGDIAPGIVDDAARVQRRLGLSARSHQSKRKCSACHGHEVEIRHSGK